MGDHPVHLKFRALFSSLAKFIPWLIGAIGIPAIVGFFAHPHLPAWVWNLLWAPAVVLVGMAVWSGVELIIRWRERELGRGISERWADRTEVDMVHSLCARLYGREDHIINKDSLRDFMEANSRTAKLFFKGQEAVGLYIMFSIRKSASEKLLHGTFRSAQQLDRKSAVKDRGRPDALYVTNIAAFKEAWPARGKALQSLELDIKDRIDRHRTIRYIFGRVANEDGGRLIEGNGFVPIHHDRPKMDQVWKLEVQPGILENHRQRRSR